MTDQPISRRRAETRQRLMEAAFAVFAERGVLAASVEEICERAGFTRGAFYSNFDSKNDLVLAMLREEGARSHALVAQVQDSDAIDRLVSDPDRLFELTAEAIRATVHSSREQRDRVMATAEMRLYAARKPGIREAYLEFRRSSKAQLLAQLRQLAQASGWEFAIPEESALEVMDTMFERSVIKASMVDPDGTRPDLVDEVVRPYVDVMTAIMRPLASAPQEPTDG